MLELTFQETMEWQRSCHPLKTEHLFCGHHGVKKAWN